VGIGMGISGVRIHTHWISFYIWEFRSLGWLGRYLVYRGIWYLLDLASLEEFDLITGSISEF
jgi:hypothetical protein